MHMLAEINPTVLPALRIAATFFFIIYLLFGAYIFRNRHRFFDRDPNVDNDIPVVRKVRIEVVMIPWLGVRSEEHTSELQSQSNLVCRLLLEKKSEHCLA